MSERVDIKASVIVDEVWIHDLEGLDFSPPDGLRVAASKADLDRLVADLIDLRERLPE